MSAPPTTAELIPPETGWRPDKCPADGYPRLPDTCGIDPCILDTGDFVYSYAWGRRTGEEGVISGTTWAFTIPCHVVVETSFPPEPQVTDPLMVELPMTGGDTILALAALAISLCALGQGLRRWARR